MKGRMVIPAAVAMALHACLLFGFNHPRVITVGDRHRLPIPLDPVPKETIRVEVSADPRNSDDPPPAGNPAPVPVQLPELPSRETITEITMERTVPRPQPIATTTIPRGPIGIPTGNINGTGPSEGGVFSPSLLDNPPRTKSQVSPIYPYEARMAGRPGAVLVEFVVDESGRVLEPHVLSSNDPLFDAPTLRAVAKWRFEPGRRDGRVVRFRMTVPVAFAVNQ
ncbi:MAG: energy transducer TonB [Opitutaceae bacterium]